MHNWFLDDLVKLSSSVINLVIKNVIVPAAEGYFTNIVKNLNKMIANEGPMDFEVPLGSNNMSALNLTMTTAPALKEGSDLIVINFDGLVDKLTGVSNTQSRGSIPAYAPRLQHSDSEQIWIHESTFSSVVENANGMLFPIDLASVNNQKEFYKAFPELNAYYGNSTGFVRISMTADSNEQPVKFDMVNGLTFGSGAKSQVDFVVSNATSPNQTALSFEANVVLNSPTYLKNFVLFPSISNIECTETKLTHSMIDLKLNDTEIHSRFSQIISSAA